jgi:hypothetical protein
MELSQHSREFLVKGALPGQRELRIRRGAIAAPSLTIQLTCVAGEVVLRAARALRRLTGTGSAKMGS